MELLYYNNQTRQRQTVRVDAEKGSWNLSQGGLDLGFILAGKEQKEGVSTSIRKWLVINFEPRNMRRDYVDTFLRTFMKLARECAAALCTSLQTV